MSLKKAEPQKTSRYQPHCKVQSLHLVGHLWNGEQSRGETQPGAAHEGGVCERRETAGLNGLPAQRAEAETRSRMQRTALHGDKNINSSKGCDDLKFAHI